MFRILLRGGGATGTNSISGAPMPTGNISSGGHTWTQIFAEDFTKDAALGSWGNDCDASFIAYTGLTGTKWRAYPKCFLDTYQKRPYRSDAVLSVQNGMLDFWLHTVDGKPAGANPSPVLPNGTVYQTYGRYEARIRQTTMNLSDYHQAWLLWPQTQSDWQCAESDFPEKRMSTTSVSAYHHYGCTGSQDSYSKTLDKTQWHTYTQEWMPGRRNYYVDGVLIGSSTNAVYDKPQRWQLQTETDSTCETTNTCTQDGHLQVDWVVVYAY
jgi:Glycosyl hydrolases family 16